MAFFFDSPCMILIRKVNGGELRLTGSVNVTDRIRELWQIATHLSLFMNSVSLIHGSSESQFITVHVFCENHSMRFWALWSNLKLRLSWEWIFNYIFMIIIPKLLMYQVLSLRGWVPLIRCILYICYTCHTDCDP